MALLNINMIRYDAHISPQKEERVWIWAGLSHSYTAEAEEFKLPILYSTTPVLMKEEIRYANVGMWSVLR